MNFLTISFLTAGALAALIPIILHFLMKGKPKQAEFPAICFIKETISRNRRRYTFKHFFLLLLRVLLLVGIGLLLARPFFRADLFSGSSGLKSVSVLSSGEAPAATALVIDTSLRMNRQDNNRTQLDEAREYALSVLSRLPSKSEVAIIRSGSEHDSFQVDLLAARRAVQDLTVVSPARSMPDSIFAAVRLLQTSKLNRRELFVITDKSAESWPVRQKENLIRFLDDLRKNRSSDQPELNIYLVDCQGKRIPSSAFANSSLLNSGLSAETASANTSIRFDAELAHTGKAKEISVELSLLPLSKNFSKNNENKKSFAKNDSSESVSGKNNMMGDSSTVTGTEEDKSLTNEPAKSEPAKNELTKNEPTTNELTKKGNQFFEQAEKKSVRAVSFPDGDSRRTASFQLSGLSQGFYQGALRFSQGDALSEDNIRWFTFEIKSDSKILIVAPDPIERKALFLQEALAPAELRKAGNAPFDPETVSLARFDKITSVELDRYQAIFILDPDSRITTKTEDLLAFVRNGGGLAIFLGRHAVPSAWQNSAAARDLLGGKISQQVRVPDWKVYLNPRGYENGVLAPFRSFSTGTEIPWSALTVGRYWHITDLSEQAVRLIDYSDGRPALYSRMLGNGTILIGSFPISDLPDETPWNLIPAGDASWIFLVMMDGAARSLIAGRTSGLNYLAGEPVVLRASGEKLPDKAEITLPDGQKLELSTEKEKQRILYPRADQTGHYRLTVSTGRGEIASSNSIAQIPSGFSVNYAPNEFNLAQRTVKEIESFFPAQTARWISKDEDLESVRTRQRVGRELYPILLLLLSGLVIYEMIYSNRFYGK